jgi:hypothetical protein
VRGRAHDDAHPAGHDVHLEAPDMLTTALTGFLETL